MSNGLIFAFMVAFNGYFGLAQCEELCGYRAYYQNQGKIVEREGSEFAVKYRSIKGMRVGNSGVIYQYPDSKYAPLPNHYPEIYTDTWEPVSISTVWVPLVEAKIIAIKDSVVRYRIMRPYYVDREPYESVTPFESGNIMIFIAYNYTDARFKRIQDSTGYAEGCMCKTTYGEYAEGVWKYYDDNGAIYKEALLSYNDEIGPVTLFQANGDTLSVGAVNYKGERMGIWREFHPNGNLAAVTEYWQGTPYGLQQTYHENGQLASEGELNYHNERRGTWVTYYPSGEIASRTPYDNADRIEGLYEEFYENGQHKVKGVYDSYGDREGEWEAYYEDGSIKTKTRYSSLGKAEKITDWYANGYLKRELELDFFDSDTIRVAYFYENGNLRLLKELDDGIFDGRYEAYYPSGQVKIKGEYRNGIKQGKWLEYYENGQLKLLEPHAWGTINGELKEYYPNGQLKLKAHYIKDKRNGLYQEFYDDGAPKLSGSYESGNKVGTWLIWDAAGKKRKERY